MPLSAAVLDAMLKTTGATVVFADASTTKGKLRTEQFVETDGQNISIAGSRTTLLIRDGTQPAALKEQDTLTVAGAAHRVRSTGVANADGTRTLTLVGG